MCGFGENGDFAVKGPPETAPGLTFINGFHPGGEEAPISAKHCEFNEIQLNVADLRKFH